MPAAVSRFVNLRKSKIEREQPVLLAYRPRAGKVDPLRSHNMDSNPRIVRRAVRKDWKPPTRGMGLLTRKILRAFGWRPSLQKSEVADAPTLEPIMLNDAPLPAQVAM